jgi:WD40 repeat protein
METSDNLDRNDLSTPNQNEVDRQPIPLGDDLAIAAALNPAIFARLDSVVYSTAISPDGRRAVAGLEDGSLHLFNLIDGSLVGQPFSGHDSSVMSVAFSPDGRFIVSGYDPDDFNLH